MGNTGNKDTVYCFDAVTGEEKWNYPYPAPLAPKMYEGGPNATPTVKDGRVYTFAKNGLAICLDVTNGKVLWSKDLPKDHIGSHHLHEYRTTDAHHHLLCPKTRHCMPGRLVW